MLSGNGQYFPPEYLHSIPTSTPENQKSPLELLAQTCSSIGKDTTPTKISLPALDKSNEKPCKSPIEEKPASRSEEKKESQKDSGKPGFRTVPYTDMPPLVPISNHDESSCSSSEHNKPSSPTPSIEIKDKAPVVEKKTSPVKPQSPPKEIPTEHRKPSSVSPSSHQKGSLVSSPSIHHTSSSTSVSAAHSAYLNGLRPGSNPVYSGLPGAPHLPYSAGLSLMGHGISPEAAALYQSQLLAHSGLHAPSISAAAAAAQQSALKAGAAAAAASMNPYVSYTRVRTPSGATALVPVCKDPYCTNCQLTVQTSHTSTTCKTPGCSQCAHEKALLGLSASSSAMGLPGSPLSLYPGLSSLPTSATGLSSLHSLYSHSALSAHQGLPYVCNWVSGHDYCGKRFNSSEELMQHLRSHTSSIDSGLPVGYGLGLPSSLSAASAGLVHLGGSAPISPNALRRGYPTSLSPGLLAGSRFHPYKSPLGSVAAPPSGQQFPPLGAYYPPYSSLYPPRLGAAVP